MAIDRRGAKLYAMGANIAEIDLSSETVTGNIYHAGGQTFHDLAVDGVTGDLFVTDDANLLKRVPDAVVSGIEYNARFVGFDSTFGQLGWFINDNGQVTFETNRPTGGIEGLLNDVDGINYDVLAGLDSRFFVLNDIGQIAGRLR